MADEALLSTVKRLDSKINTLLKEKKLVEEKKKQTWVKASMIMELTGWDREKFRRMRGYGAVVQRKDETGIWYDLETLNPIYYKTPKD